MRDERTGIADGRQKVHVPPAEQSHLQIAHQVGGFVIEEEVRRCFRQLPTISVRLPEVIVEVKVFATAPNAPVRHPQQAGLAWLEGALELTAEGNFVRNRTASKALLPTRWVGTPASVSSTRSRHHSRASTTVRKCMKLRARPNGVRLSCGAVV